MKKSLKNLLLLVSISLFILQTQLFAMEEDADFTLINQATSRLQTKLRKLNEDKEDLSRNVEQQKGNLKEADNLIALILDPNTTPPAIEFLRAVYRKAPEQQLQKLYHNAINKREIYNIITGGHTKFRGDAPDAHNSLLELCGLLGNVRVTDNFATVQYSSLVVHPSPEKALRSAARTTIIVKEREEQQLEQNFPDSSYRSPGKKKLDDDEERIKKESIKYSIKEGSIGPREISGWELEDVEDNGNCFYDAVVLQMRKIGHVFLTEILSETLPRDSLRLRIQGEKFRDKEWADYRQIDKFVEEFDIVLGVIDTRNPQHGFTYYYLGDDGQVVTQIPDEQILLPNKPIIRLAYTGNHFLSVVTHPN